MRNALLTPQIKGSNVAELRAAGQEEHDQTHFGIFSLCKTVFHLVTLCVTFRNLVNLSLWNVQTSLSHSHHTNIVWTGSALGSLWTFFQCVFTTLLAISTFFNLLLGSVSDIG